MKRAGILALFAALFIGGCQGEPPETDQVAQQSLIGLKARAIRACLGEPETRAPVGKGTEIWTYPIGAMRGYGPQWAVPLNTNVPPFAGGGACEARFTMTNNRVSAVGYAGPDGEALPLGQECVFPVERCAPAP